MSSEVLLTGRLVCQTEAEMGVVREHLPLHVELSRAEDGCLAFDVEAAEDPMVWTVRERFVDAAAFRAHQERVAQSEWGRATIGIERRYEIEASSCS